jgi:hypothetical protein
MADKGSEGRCLSSKGPGVALRHRTWTSRPSTNSPTPFFARLAVAIPSARVRLRARLEAPRSPSCAYIAFGVICSACMHHVLCSAPTYQLYGQACRMSIARAPSPVDMAYGQYYCVWRIRPSGSPGNETQTSPGLPSALASVTSLFLPTAWVWPWLAWVLVRPPISSY